MSARPVIPTDWLVGRGVTLYGKVVESTEDAAAAGKDISSANITIRFRAYRDEDETSYLKNVTLTKGTGSGATGFYSGYVPSFTTAYDALWGELVMVDAGTADAGTPTGYKEVSLERRQMRVKDSAT